MKNILFRLFYHLHKLQKKPTSPYIAALAVTLLQLTIIASSFFYIVVYASKAGLYINTVQFSVEVTVIAIIIIIQNYLLFIRTDEWKEYVSSFDELPDRSIRLGNQFVIGLTIFILLNFLVSVFLCLWR